MIHCFEIKGCEKVTRLQAASLPAISYKRFIEEICSKSGLVLIAVCPQGSGTVFSEKDRSLGFLKLSLYLTRILHKIQPSGGPFSRISLLRSILVPRRGANHAFRSKTAPAATFEKIDSPVTISNLTVLWREHRKDQHIKRLTPEPAKPRAICGLGPAPIARSTAQRSKTAAAQSFRRGRR